MAKEAGRAYALLWKPEYADIKQRIEQLKSPSKGPRPSPTIQALKDLKAEQVEQIADAKRLWIETTELNHRIQELEQAQTRYSAENERLKREFAGLRAENSKLQNQVDGANVAVFPPKRSNRATAKKAAERVRDLIEQCEAAGGALPSKQGALWHAEIKRQATLSNPQINDNPKIKQMLKEHAAKHGLAFSRRGKVAPEEHDENASAEQDLVLAKKLRETQQRLAERERRCAELRAENVGLRAQLARRSEIGELIAFGGRFFSGPSEPTRRGEEDFDR